MVKTWFITGSSNGFGLELVKVLLERGHSVVATSRRPEVLAELVTQYPEKIITPTLDVTSQPGCEQAVAEALATFGKIDVLVNNAGFGVFGAIEEVPDSEVRRQFETNFFGVLNVLRAALPTMRAQRSGRILNISSIAGLLSFGGSGIYCASKHALEAISESLHYELSPLGIRTILIEPGMFRTDFLGQNYRAVDVQSPDYAETAGETLGRISQAHQLQPGDPVKAVKAMIDVAEMEDPPLRLLQGEDAWVNAHNKLDWLNRDFDANEKITRNLNFDN